MLTLFLAVPAPLDVHGLVPGLGDLSSDADSCWLAKNDSLLSSLPEAVTYLDPASGNGMTWYFGSK